MKILEEFNMVPFFCRSKHEFIFTEGEKKQLAHVPCSLGKSSRTCHFMWKAMCTGGSWMLSVLLIAQFITNPLQSIHDCGNGLPNQDFPETKVTWLQLWQ